MKLKCILIPILLLSACVSNPAISSLNDLNEDSGYLAASYSVVDDHGEVIRTDPGTCYIRLKNIKTEAFESILLNDLNNIEVFNLDDGEYIVTFIGLYDSVVNIYFPNKFRVREHLEVLPIELLKKIEVKEGEITYLGKIVIRHPTEEKPSIDISYIDDFDSVASKNNSTLKLVRF